VSDEKACPEQRMTTHPRVASRAMIFISTPLFSSILGAYGGH
jgi:hypothetical protein